MKELIFIPLLIHSWTNVVLMWGEVLFVEFRLWTCATNQNLWRAYRYHDNFYWLDDRFWYEFDNVYLQQKNKFWSIHQKLQNNTLKVFTINHANIFFRIYFFNHSTFQTCGRKRKYFLWKKIKSFKTKKYIINVRGYFPFFIFFTT